LEQINHQKRGINENQLEAPAIEMLGWFKHLSFPVFSSLFNHISVLRIPVFSEDFLGWVGQPPIVNHWILYMGISYGGTPSSLDVFFMDNPAING
jgi:hypothetical protein